MVKSYMKDKRFSDANVNQGPSYFLAFTDQTYQASIPFFDLDELVLSKLERGVLNLATKESQTNKNSPQKMHQKKKKE